MKLLQCLAAVFCLIFPTAVFAEDLEMINRPVNTSGLTGLLFTTSPYTLPPNAVEVGIMAVSENSLTPDYTLTEYPLTVSVGIGRSMEAALKGSYFYRNEASLNKTRGMGDAELLYKWNFRPQPEYSASPAVSLIAAGIIPTAGEDAGMNSVSHWGARLGLSAGSEISLADHVLGIYTDAQMAVQDLSDERTRDRYYLIDAGLIVPISKYRNLQMFLEYNVMGGKDVITVTGVDSSSITYGLRLVNERFNLSIGTQFVRKKVEGYNDSSRVIGMMSMKL